MLYSDARSPSSTDQDELTGFTADSVTGSRVWVQRTLTTPNLIVKVPLYGTSTADARVQCATCHDTHAKTTTFLRVDNTAGSALCLTCHIK